MTTFKVRIRHNGVVVAEYVNADTAAEAIEKARARHNGLGTVASVSVLSS
ncbi:MAG: hypothetical protein ACOYOQ_00420 [Microthrixaceae bacterium]